MSAAPSEPADPCIVDGVEPLLGELNQPISLHVHADDDDRRGPVEHFIRQVFQRSYGARLHSLYPTLLAFSSNAGLHGAVGLRDPRQGPLFAEQYLDTPAEAAIAAHWQAPADRARIVEVGNLAMATPGEARWLIAAVTAFLHASGYRWVLFTAVQPLVNAFQRLGLNPVRLGDADPARLRGGSDEWGSYYAQRPVVCVGDIQSGYRKLTGHVSPGQPRLHALLIDACLHARPEGPCAEAAW